MKPLVIYHANCADGFGAAFAAWLKLGDEAEYKPCAYADKDFTHPSDIREIVDDRDVYILDFSFPRPVMDQIFTDAKRVVWLDHHASAFKEHGFAPNAPGEPAIKPLTKHTVILDNNKSGAYLAWEYFHPGAEAPMLIQHIDDYDRWQFKIDGTKAFNKALWSHAPWSFEQWSQFLKDTGFSANDGTGIDAWYREGTAILRSHDQNVQVVVKGAARKCMIECEGNVAVIASNTFENSLPGPCHLPGLAANCPSHLTSDVGHELATQSGTFGLCWTLSKEGLVAKCSLRSNGEYDVSAIAKVFGGGGHRNAAGFEVPIDVLLGWLK